MGGIGKAISNFADDALGFDPNGGGFVPYYDLAGTALGYGPVGTMGATGVNAINQITGQGGQQGALGQILGGVGAGVGQAQKNSQQDKLADTLMSYLDKGITTAGANNITNLNTGMGNTLSNLFKEQSDIVGNKMANQNSPFQAGISQFLQPTQGQSGGGLGGLLGGLGGLFGGGSSSGFNLGSIFGGGGSSTPVSSGGGSFGNFGTSGFGF
jgi:hypothetical protein